MKFFVFSSHIVRTTSALPVAKFDIFFFNFWIDNLNSGICFEYKIWIFRKLFYVFFFVSHHLLVNFGAQKSAPFLTGGGAFLSDLNESLLRGALTTLQTTSVNRDDSLYNATRFCNLRPVHRLAFLHHFSFRVHPLRLLFAHVFTLRLSHPKD